MFHKAVMYFSGVKHLSKPDINNSKRLLYKMLHKAVMYFSGVQSIQLQPHTILNQLKSAVFSESTSIALTAHPDGACLLV